MSVQTASSRRLILDRIRAGTGNPSRTVNGTANGTANGDANAYGAIPRNYIRHGVHGFEERLQLMIDRLREYDAEVVECAPEELSIAVAKELSRSGKRIFVVPEGLPAEWLAPGFDWRLDGGLDTEEVNKAEGVVTAAFCGVADSGTIVLHHGAEEGRRIITLLPDWHLCILRASQVVETFPEYFSRCRQTPSLVTWISGPSATADIEMTRIKGVHGPRFLVVILVRDQGKP
jgi:L-lactate dehydrogenase complex protein LldG